MRPELRDPGRAPTPPPRVVTLLGLSSLLGLLAPHFVRDNRARSTVAGMSNDPDEGQNPFKGTPFEQFFAGGMGGKGMPDLNQLFGQLQSMLQPYDGPLNCCTYAGSRCGVDEACCGTASCLGGYVGRKLRLKRAGAGA